jgi:predicted small lipoprotein YifL
MKKFAVACAAAALMSLAACGQKPAAETGNAANAAVTNEMDNAAGAVNNAANSMAEASNSVTNAATNTASNASE